MQVHTKQNTDSFRAKIKDQQNLKAVNNTGDPQALCSYFKPEKTESGEALS